MDYAVKQEVSEAALPPDPTNPAEVIDLSSSDDEDEVTEKKPGVLDGFSDEGGPLKRRKLTDGTGIVLPLGFLDPLPSEVDPPLPPSRPLPISVARPPAPEIPCFKQFWKAGDYVGDAVMESSSFSAGMDHVRVHPKFLHSNATSHKWALGALAELLDNSLDEVCHGATFINIDVLENNEDGSKILLVEDNGGGMDPDKIRQCMSLGYSTKTKSTNTIGQYGNGFKTSTMRLGADVIVFSRCHGKGGKCATQSIGMLSYTFLRNTGKEDIVVPILDYENRGQNWNKLMRSSSVDWDNNLETIVRWSPYSSEADLLQQFNSVSDQGTRIVIYNLWEDDEGELELDFGADEQDIQIRGVNRDEKKIEMARQFPNSKHFLTYRHSLRSYASILYLRLPKGFKMILRGKEIHHHNIVNDMMLKQDVTYKPQSGSNGIPRDPNMVAVVMIGFVKDAKYHIDVQGFNVYHKNRLIKPFWRVWNAAGSGGRGVIGVLEVNFVEPAHDKQDFERTTVLSRLEARLLVMQKHYWKTNCYQIGYAPLKKEKSFGVSRDKESSPEAVLQPSSQKSRKEVSPNCMPTVLSTVGSLRVPDVKLVNGHMPVGSEIKMRRAKKFGYKTNASKSTLYEQPHASDESDSEIECVSADRLVNGSGVSSPFPTQKSFCQEAGVTCTGDKLGLQDSMKQLKDENSELKDRILKMEELTWHKLEFERDRNKLLNEKLEESEKNFEELNKEQEALMDIFSEERIRREEVEENLRNKLKDASNTIHELQQKLSFSMNSIKPEP